MSRLSLRIRKNRASADGVVDDAVDAPAADEVPVPEGSVDLDNHEVTSSVEDLDGDQVRLTVTVGAGRFEHDIDKAFRKLAHEVRLPGFRPGKAPRRILEARLGAAAGRHEAIQDSVPDHYRQALVDNQVDAIDSPSLEITSGEESGDLVFDAVVPVRPSVAISGYADLTVEVPAPVATDEEVESQVDTLRRQHGTLEVVQRAAEDGDRVTIDIEGSHEGEPVEGLTATDYLYQVGSGAVVAEIDENLRGAAAGDEVEFDADHPQEEGTLHLRIAVKEVQALVLPEADDAFAAEASEFATIAELTDDLRGRIASMKRAQAAMLSRENTARAVAGLVTDDIPDALVEAAIDERFRDMAMRMAQQGIDLAHWMEATGQDAAAMREGFRDDAGVSARADLGLRAVAVAEGLDASDEEVEAHLGLVAIQAGQPEADLADLRKQMAESGHLMEILADLRKQAAMDWLVEHVSFVDEDGNAIDRADLTPPEPEVVVPAAGDAPAVDSIEVDEPGDIEPGGEGEQESVGEEE